MIPSPDTNWRAIDPANDAMVIRGRPPHAFWPLLAPSFRWVLLPPHRRAGGGEIAWEWQGPHPAPRPSPSDLNALRLRLRDGIELFEVELSRRDTLPEGLSTEDLRRGVERMLRDLRRGPDQVLAAHAVLTSRGWMVRSWGFARPAPAQAETKDSDAHTPVASAAPAPAALAASSRRPTSGRLSFRRWAVAFVLGSLALGLALGVRALRSPNEARATESAPLSESAQTHPVPSEARPLPSPAAPRSAAGATPGAVAAQAAEAAGAAGAAQPPRSATPPPTAPAHASLTAHAAGLTTTPLAITGTMSGLPEAQVGLAGPPSRLPGTSDAPPVLAIPQGGAAADAPLADRTAPDPAPIPPTPAQVPGGDEGPPVMPVPAPSPVPQIAETRDGKSASLPARVVVPAPFSVEAREAPAPTPSPAPKPGAEPSAANAPPADSDAAETFSPADPQETTRTHAASGEQLSPIAAAARAPTHAAKPAAGNTSSENASSGLAPPRTTGLATIFRGHAMPWRLVLERDAPLPTRPTEQDAEAEMRAARIAAWAEARTRVPHAFRKREGRAGWSLLLATEAATHRPRWLVARGSPLSAEQTLLVDDEARIAWREDDTRDLDAVLVTEDGEALAHVRRRAAENRIDVRTSPAVLEVRAWFSLRLKTDANDEDLAAPAGWSVKIENGELSARGPAGAVRMRWEHAASGWTLHGGYARENP